MVRLCKLVLVGLLLLSLSGCDKLGKEPGLSLFTCLDPDGDILAVLVGLKIKRQDRPAVQETRLVLLRLDEKSFLKSYHQLEDYVIRDMAWRPSHDSQLYYATFEDVYGAGGYLIDDFGRNYKHGNGKLVLVDANSDENPATSISQNGPLNILSYFRWSPDGNILAGLATTGEIKSSGVLAFSFDGGKTCESSGINISGPAVWLNDKGLFAKTDKNTYVKFSRDGQKFKITETSKKGFGIGLGGIFQEKLVYLAHPRKDDKGKALDKSRRVFVGEHLLYETDNPHLKVRVFTGKIVVEDDGKVMIFDENLSLCHERLLGRDTHLLNFQPNNNIVFLVEDWDTILCYDYTKNEKPRVLFSVDMLN